MIGGNVKPHCLSIGNEELLLRCLIFPTHSTRPAEVDSSRFGLETLAAIAVSLEKHRLKGFGVVIASLESTSGGSSARVNIGSGGFDGNDDRQRAAEEENRRLLHTNSLASSRLPLKD